MLIFTPPLEIVLTVSATQVGKKLIDANNKCTCYDTTTLYVNAEGQHIGRKTKRSLKLVTSTEE